MRWLVVLALLLAGCSSPPSQVVDAGDPEPPVVTRPDDFGYNTTQAHYHDYWSGRTGFMVLDTERGLGSIAQTPAADFPVRGGTDQVIPQGARWVNITATWDLSEPTLYDDVELLVRTAASAEPIALGRIQSGGTAVFESTNAHNDLPHQRLSAWEFIVRFHADATGWLILQGTLHVSVHADRGLEIPLYPGHPDKWRGAVELPLLAEENALGVTSAPVGVDPYVYFGYACVGQCLSLHRPDDGQIVPHDTALVEVVVRETASSGAAGMPSLLFHAADSLQWQAATPERIRGGEATYRIPVGPGGDGPYAQRSLWEFLLIVDPQDAKHVFAGSYEIEARALRMAP